jgi:hypothetical protein
VPDRARDDRLATPLAREWPITRAVGSDLVVTLNSLGLTPTIPSLAMRAATVLRLTRSPASCRSALTGATRRSRPTPYGS